MRTPESISSSILEIFGFKNITKQRMEKNNKNIGQPTPSKWELTEEQRLSYQALYVLYLITEKKVLFPNFLTGNLKFAQESVDFLESKKLIVQQENIIEGKKILGVSVEKSDAHWVYEPSKEACQIVDQHRKQFREFLTFYDVYGHVDPSSGEFAFSKIKKHLLKENGKEAWESYKNKDRWVDYRVPVAVYKGLDPREFIFFSFMEEGRFIPTEKDTENVWAKNLFLGDIWEELYGVLNSAPIWEEQGDDENPATKIMEAIIVEGAKVLKKQRKKLQKFIKNQDNIIGLEEELEVLEGEHAADDEDEYDYYEEYYEDPIYYHHGYYYTPLSSPLFWVGAAIIL